MKYVLLLFLFCGVSCANPEPIKIVPQNLPEQKQEEKGKEEPQKKERKIEKVMFAILVCNNQKSTERGL